MKLFWILFFCIFSSASYAQPSNQAGYAKNGPYFDLNVGTALTVTTTATGLSNIPASAQYVLLYVVGGSVNWGTSASPPTAAQTAPQISATSNIPVTYSGGQAGLKALQFILPTGVTGVTVIPWYFS